MKSSAELLSQAVVDGGKVLRPRAFLRPDPVLVAAVRNGEADAKEQLFARYGDDVVRLMVALTGPYARCVPDAVARVFAGAVREIERRDPGALLPLLTRTGVRVATRRAAPRRRREPSTEPSGLSRDHLELYRSLHAVSAEDRVVFALHFVLARPAHEVAAAAGLSLTSARRRLSRTQAVIALDRPARELGREVAREQADWTEQNRIVDDARERFLQPPPVRRRRDVRAFGLVAFLAVAAVAVWLRPAATASFTVGEAALGMVGPGMVRPGMIREWVAAPDDGAVSITFDDGHRCELLAGARARVVRADRGEGELRLERGTLRVTPGGVARWTYTSGPFDLVAREAKFEARWTPNREALDVRVQKGQVRVTGPDGLDRLVGAGASLAVHALDGVVE
ncbi:MAG: hypothetical protein AAGN82_06170 [Myxococcota bacterium]